MRPAQLSPLVALATGEQPPQAQVFATDGTLILPSGTTSIRMSIKPVEPASLPTDGTIDGNVYRIRVANQAGLALTAPAANDVTIVLRSPGGGSDPRIEQLVAGTWTPLATDDAGFGSSFIAIVTSFGDFAIVTGTAPARPSSSASEAPEALSSPIDTPETTPAPASTAQQASGGQPAFWGAFVAVGVATAVVALLVGADIRRRRRRRTRTR